MTFTTPPYFLSPLVFLELLTFMIASGPITLFAAPSPTSYMEDPYLDIDVLLLPCSYLSWFEVESCCKMKIDLQGYV